MTGQVLLAEQRCMYVPLHGALTAPPPPFPHAMHMTPHPPQAAGPRLCSMTNPPKPIAMRTCHWLTRIICHTPKQRQLPH